MPGRLMKPALRGLARLPAAVARRIGGPAVAIDGQRLDPHVQMLLRLSGTTHDDLPPPEVLRAQMDDQADWLAPRPARPVARAAMTLPGGAGPRPARRYTPQGRAGQGALLYFHGGGFVAGSLTSHDPVCATLADRAGCEVIAYDYRLAPEHPFPAAAEDAVAAWRGLVAAAPSLGLDPARLAVGGDSAGGNLAALVAQTCRDDPHPPVWQMLWVPWVDLSRKYPSHQLFGRGFLLEDAKLDWYADRYLSGHDPADPRVSPIYGVLAGVCPAEVVTAAFDPLRDEGAAYAQALRAAGVAVIHDTVPGMPHVFANVAGYLAAAGAALDTSAARLHRALEQVR